MPIANGPVPTADDDGCLPMNALSRREEETLLKTTKARALRECDTVVKEFAECANGRTVSVAWACRDSLKKVQACMVQYTGPGPMEAVRAEYLRLRNQQHEEQLLASKEPTPLT